ncbi:predicted protein [Lichtheimia corymbifera JMRC:FSU:9682]|uniref:Uncharacterized protein n=1 Tax=Lichtheimia corymbifera JMRC:FSU:9682 TaxID=1263082 RepID=A0A068SCH3_9FUNG|nr:predicted protein [Lichtheimia corymbifera JMRC:FSU:9682]
MQQAIDPWNKAKLFTEAECTWLIYRHVCSGDVPFSSGDMERRRCVGSMRLSHVLCASLLCQHASCKRVSGSSDTFWIVASILLEQGKVVYRSRTHLVDLSTCVVMHGWHED